MKETSELIKQAQTEYDGMYLIDTRAYFVVVCAQSVPKLMFSSIYKEKFKTVILLLFLALPPEARIHNLLSLAAKDSEITDKPESAGSSLLVQHQELLLEQFGHKHTAVLPKDVIQRLLLGIILSSMLILLHLSVIISFDLLQFLPFIPFQALFLTVQSTRTLELALHLQQKVIKLKQVSPGRGYRFS